MNTISNKDRAHLRALAQKQWDYANLPKMKKRISDWYDHNDMQGDTPMIHVEVWTFEQDLLPELQCESEDARKIELQIQREIVNHENIDDDRVVKDFFNIDWFTNMKPFNLDVRTEQASDGGVGHEFIHSIKDFPKDFYNLEPTIYNVDRNSTLQYIDYVNDIFGDILPAKLSGGSYGSCPTQDIVHFMGMEAMIFAMMDYPDEFKAFIGKLTDDYLEYFKWLQSENLLLLNNGNNHLGQGTFGFTNQLPKQTIGDLTLSDVWGYMDSQETVSISPAMFEEFIFPSYYKISQNFGLMSYGCCEPVHTIWDNCISKMDNLRKVSISPWCDENIMGEKLAGSDTIFQRKPSPNYIGVGSVFDEEGYSKHMLETILAAKGCKLEFSFRDIYTLTGDKEKPRRAVKILRELIEKNW